MKMTVAEFCLALHRVCLRSNRDDQGAGGETLWASLEWVEEKHGSETVEVPATIKGVVARARGLGVDARELRIRLTRMPDWHRVLHDWNEYRDEWWGISR
ncbi:hypothetical protein A3H75_01595 [Candidatus Uhrbacteria bacterium RIFCSPLOWO2_02_FULL_51_9]|uniref:Uncharacterized protein n=1 Tax=Candidatus Uhrbacteria bacterium RIFCSPLOWO2_02_FULL_51_9 TaxID=1802410 RepID=A0A1F7VFK6_9BACT|nr:MAG: hypothetical protein A3H75_01595 [Candidatus Uhrbacteria bacterium RIFCSPLOWO2_02_FULL_51_9]